MVLFRVYKTVREQEYAIFMLITKNPHGNILSYITRKKVDAMGKFKKKIESIQNACIFHIFFTEHGELRKFWAKRADKKKIKESGTDERNNK